MTFTNTCDNKLKTDNIHFLSCNIKSDIDIDTLPPALVATNLNGNSITVPAHCLNSEVSLFIDTGASANVINLDTLEKLRSKARSVLVLEPPDSRLIGLDNSQFKVIGKIELPISFKRGNVAKSITLHVTDNLLFPADILLGICGMIDLEILVYPNKGGIYHNNRFIAAISPAQPILNPHNNLQATVNNITIKHELHCESSNIKQPIISNTNKSIVNNVSERSLKLGNNSPDITHVNDNNNKNNKVNLKHPDSTNISIPSSSLSISQDLLMKTHGFLSRDAVIEGHESILACLKLARINGECEAISMNETMKVSNICVESALCTVNKDGYTNIFIHNTSPNEKKIHKGTNLVEFAILPWRLGAISNLPELPLENKEEDIKHKEKVKNVLTECLKDSSHPHAHAKLIDMLLQTHNILAIEGDKLGTTNLVTHHIPVKDGTKPIYIPAYRFPHSKRALLDNIIDDMLKDDVIEHSNSPWNFPLFLVPKKNGTWRAVVDYRQLNKVCEKTRYPLPILQDILMSIGEDKKIFTTLDFINGYWQIKLDENSKKYTSFSTPTGKYNFKKMPMGAACSPITMQKLVNTIFKGILGKYVHVFMDDILICSTDIETHLQHLQEVFNRLEKANLKVKVSKCKFLKERLKFLGHVLDGNGVHTSQDKIEAILKFPNPTDVKTLKSFLGVSGFYRAFIKNYSQIAKPLTNLLKKDVEFHWGDEQEKSFSKLKECLSSSPVLAYPNFKESFYIYTDASGIGLGAVLMQKDIRGKLRPIAFASRVLNSAEQNYSTTHREALACIWALKHFKDICYGYEIIVRTDHAPVVELFNTKDLTGKLARWRLTVLDFQPTFEYLPGRHNVVADSLSRNLIATLQDINKFDDLTKFQREDSFCKSIIYYLESGDETHMPNICIPMSEFRLDNDILVRDTSLTLKHEPKRQVTQVVIPNTLISNILQTIHDSPQAGHPGKEKCLSQAKLNFYWPKMRLDINNHIDKCESCAEHKGHTGKQVPILNYPIPKAPWETLAIDLLKLPLTENQFQYLMVCIDHFSRFCILVPLKDKSAKSVAKALIDEVFCKYNTPRHLLSDNGTEFNNAILEEICQIYNINKINIIAYHPASNGLVERQNRKIIQILKQINNPPSFHWDEWICQVASTLNSSINKAIAETPHFIVFGQDKRLPYSIVTSNPKPLYNPDDYAKLRLNDFHKIYMKVTEALASSKREMIKNTNKNSKEKDLNIGDLVYMKRQDMNSKLDPIFEGPFRITQKLSGNKIEIKHIQTNKQIKTHTDLVKPVSSLMDNTTIDNTQMTQQLPSNTTDIVDEPPENTTNEYKKKLRSYNNQT